MARVARNRVPRCRRSSWDAGCKPGTNHAEGSDGRKPSALDPERRLTLRQAALTRDDFSMIMDELDFVKEQLARLPTRRDRAFTQLRINRAWRGATRRIGA